MATPVRNAVKTACCLLSICTALWGSNGNGATTVSVSVTVLAPLPCVLNNNRQIEIDFGNDVITTRIDGSAYRQRVEYSLSCSEQGKNAMRLQLSGAGAAFDGTLLQTSVQGLGIAFEQQTRQKLPINSWVNFSYPNLLELYAVPVKGSGAELPTGEFTAAATLRIDYQ